MRPRRSLLGRRFRLGLGALATASGCTSLLALTVFCAPAFASRRVAIAPPAEAGSAAIDKVIVEAARTLPWLTLANVTAFDRLLPPRHVPSSARFDPDSPARAEALGRETGAERAVLTELSRLGDGTVLYLRAIQVASGHTIGSTTVPLAAGWESAPSVSEAAIAGALTRLLSPARYTGRVVLHIDVRGAEVQVDGKRADGVAAAAANGATALTLTLPVGTHALRVTQPEYHDYLRFVEIAYGQTQSLDVGLSAFPLSEGEMAARAVHEARPRTPWYRRWWAITTAGVVLAGAAASAIWLTRPGVSADRTVGYRPSLQP